jgi:hypothetical protein
VVVSREINVYVGASGHLYVVPVARLRQGGSSETIPVATVEARPAALADALAAAAKHSDEVDGAVTVEPWDSDVREASALRLSLRWRRDHIGLTSFVPDDEGGWSDEAYEGFELDAPLGAVADRIVELSEEVEPAP